MQFASQFAENHKQGRLRTSAWKPRVRIRLARATQTDNLLRSLPYFSAGIAYWVGVEGERAGLERAKTGGFGPISALNPFWHERCVEATGYRRLGIGPGEESLQEFSSDDED